MPGFIPFTPMNTDDIVYGPGDYIISYVIVLLTMLLCLLVIGWAIHRKIKEEQET